MLDGAGSQIAGGFFLVLKEQLILCETPVKYDKRGLASCECPNMKGIKLS